MVSANTTRRIPARKLDMDIDALNGLRTVEGYAPARAEVSMEALQASYEQMLAKQQQETQATAKLRSAADAARLAEWEFHNSVLAM